MVWAKLLGIPFSSSRITEGGGIQRELNNENSKATSFKCYILCLECTVKILAKWLVRWVENPLFEWHGFDPLRDLLFGLRRRSMA